MRAVLLLFAVAAIAAAENGAGADYVGGTVANLSSKSGTIDVTGRDALLFHTKHLDIRIPYERIQLLEYGQQVNRRYAMAILVSPLLILSKSRKHFLTVGYTDEEGRQQAMVLRVSKSRVRDVLVSLEAKTGRKVEFQDSEARKAGKG